MTRLQVPTGDGRTIEVLTAGDPSGIPLLFHGGSPSAVAEFPMFDEVARDRGIRLVTYSRPGYGETTPRPDPGAYADDVQESVAVLDRLGIEEFLTAGWSGGGPRVLACAALLPDRCRAAASISGCAPFHAEGLDWFDGMAEENHEEYAAAQAGPEVYESFVVEHMLPMLTATADELEEAFGGLVTPVDAAYLTADVADWLGRTFNHAAAQGAIGVRDDGLAAVTPWGFDLARIAVPVSIWHGREDAMVPYDHARWLLRNVPGAEAHLYDDEGHISILDKVDEIFADLKRLGGYTA